MMGARCIPRTVLKSALAVSQGPDSLGRSIWLFLAMIAAAGPTGTVIRTRKSLSEDLSVPESSIDTWLDRLTTTRLIRVLSPSPYLVIHIESWSNRSDAAAALKANTNAVKAVPKSSVLKNSNSYCNSSSNSMQQAIGDGGLGEGGLLQKARDVLGDLDEEELRVILDRHSPGRVARALERVEKTPKERIRKSRLALFRYLLVRIDDDPDVQT
ncbi:MAG: hypothetical protein KJ927_04125 [Candidatus Eisenbacteria bacterium]|nr:hypothetical protein [Candidatus Eisenbacteria bacterium]MBU1947876.1 hypothetical protein [Candidatus Eisenbacteria bacterium]